MAGKILGYEIASREQQKRTAMGILLFLGGAFVLGGFVLFYIASMEQRGRAQAMATVTAVDTKCRYVVRNISKRVSFYDHTGYIDCAEAENVARSNDNPLGRVEKSTIAAVVFTTAEGREITSQVELHRQSDAAVGSKVEVLYLETSPTNVTEFKDFALFGTDFVKPEQAAPGAEAAMGKSATTGDGTTTGEPRKGSPWRGLIYLLGLLAIAYWVTKRILRLMRRLASRDDASPWPTRSNAFGQQSTAPAATRRASATTVPRNTAAAAPPADHMARIINRPQR